MVESEDQLRARYKYCRSLEHDWISRTKRSCTLNKKKWHPWNAICSLKRATECLTSAKSRKLGYLVLEMKIKPFAQKQQLAVISHFLAAKWKSIKLMVLCNVWVVKCLLMRIRSRSFMSICNDKTLGFCPAEHPSRGIISTFQGQLWLCLQRSFPLLLKRQKLWMYSVVTEALSLTRSNFLITWTGSQL